MTWEIIDKNLTKDFEFKNYVDAVSFVGKITPLAEELDHHPDILIHSYRKVKIMMYTHTENKITQLDYKLAEQIDLIN
ncbi:MAG: 4a-hydroxytetrahydrobiopterin dehydratase [Nanoarchaeales archaeon]|nr:4a-hydroxytetrahydrobiopterin dehydratase [Nanoarchaeales archaeon]